MIFDAPSRDRLHRARLRKSWEDKGSIFFFLGSMHRTPREYSMEFINDIQRTVIDRVRLFIRCLNNAPFNADD